MFPSKITFHSNLHMVVCVLMCFWFLVFEMRL